jgi:hypothetical protein
MRDPDEPGPERPAVRLPQRALEVTVGLEKGLLGEVLGVVVVAHPVVAVGIDIPEVRAIDLGEPSVKLTLVSGKWFERHI